MNMEATWKQQLIFVKQFSFVFKYWNLYCMASLYILIFTYQVEIISETNVIS